MEKKRILIVDDDKEVLESLSMFLEKKGHEVLTALDGDDKTLERIRKESPDLVILDLVLPSRDGMEVLRLMKKDAEMRPIPVIICSVIRQKRRIVEGLNAGAVDYLTKPFEAEELYARVGSALLAREIAAANQRARELENLVKVARTVHEEIQSPLTEMRTALEFLGKSTALLRKEEAVRPILAEALDSLDELEQALQRFEQANTDQEHREAERGYPA